MENPVGLGVARAYWTSEKTNISGMRIILTPEVVQPLMQTPINIKGTEYIMAYVNQFGSKIKMYFKSIKGNNKRGEEIDLYELIWTYFTNGPRYEFIEILARLKPTFKVPDIKHFFATGQVIRDGLFLNDSPINVEVERNRLQALEALISG